MGNAAFTKLFDARVHESWRIANIRDVVVSALRGPNYCHTKRLASFKGLQNPVKAAFANPGQVILGAQGQPVPKSVRVSAPLFLYGCIGTRNKHTCPTCPCCFVRLICWCLQLLGALQVLEGVLVPLPGIRTWLDRIRYEMSFLTALVTGSGLQQHSSSAYLRSLLGVMQQLTNDKRALKGLDVAETALTALETSEAEVTESP